MKDFPLSILNTNEIYTSASRIDGILGTNFAADPFLSQVQPLLQTSYGDLSGALGRDDSSEFTAQLIEKDNARDAAFVGLRDFVKAFLNHPDATTRLAGTRISEIFDQVGASIYHVGYTEETAQLNALITALQAPIAQTAIQAIGADSWVTNLVNTQTAFEELYQQKVEAESQNSYPLIRDSRPKVVRYLNTILNYIDMNAELDAATFGPYVQQIDEVITDVVAIARARITRDENEEETPAE